MRSPIGSSAGSAPGYVTSAARASAQKYIYVLLGPTRFDKFHGTRLAQNNGLARMKEKANRTIFMLPQWIGKIKQPDKNSRS